MQKVKWGEYSFKSIFNNIAQGRRLKKDDQISGNIPFVMAGTTNTGIVDYISNPVANFPENSITIDIFGNTFYRDYNFGAGDDTGVYWNSKKEYTKKTMLFFAISMEKSLFGKFDYGKKLRSSQSLNFKMQLPTKNGKIDFEFMESFVADLEAERIKKLDDYLIENGLSNYHLTENEKQALENFENLNWNIFNLEKLFGKSTRGKRLKSTDRISGNLPFITAGETDEGVSAFIGNKVNVFSENTTTIDMFGSAKYRNFKYGGDDHIAVVHTEKLPKLASIFVTTSIHKSSYNGQFNYGRNFYAKDADTLDISLPLKGQKPDYETMETIISAIHKLVIKDVVLYTDKKNRINQHA
ncbi:restriction endonuclease subunit S [Labilibaculum antarcticum]|uniref:Restriction endonuclease n=1 Tax=Labilibaculum antarcticum TaxID=1717717 RepID=A0A1Y1CGB3_9BACT|nr:restriction endonuclease subunit S [Labilibaculum antarcticum]BAX79062.1 restriction endonuclease [Labilibaculum antarcticum]